MELLIAILLAMNIYVDPSWSESDLRDRNPTEYDRAVNIMNNKLYRIDTNGVIIIDETGGKN